MILNLNLPKILFPLWFSSIRKFLEQKFLPIEHALLPSSVEKFSLVNINNKEDDSLCVDLKPTGSTVGLIFLNYFELSVT